MANSADPDQLASSVRQWSGLNSGVFLYFRELNMPSIDTDKACTRLNLENTGTNKWESISCFKHAADLGVCEQPLGNVETEGM